MKQTRLQSAISCNKYLRPFIKLFAVSWLDFHHSIVFPASRLVLSQSIPSVKKHGIFKLGCIYNIKPSTKKHPNLAQQKSLLYPIKYRINMFVLVWIHINTMYITTIFWLTGGWCYQPKIHPTKHGSKTLKSHRCSSVHRKVITLFSASFPQGRGSTPTHGDSFKVLKGPELLVLFCVSSPP